MRRLRAGFLVGSAVVLVLLIWQVVKVVPPPATWLRVESPPVVAADGHLRLQVTLPAPAPAGQLVAGLHWAGSWREPKGFLSGSPAQTVTVDGGVFEFSIPVPARPELRYVTAVVYLGPSVKWADRTHAATTEAIPVRTTVAAGELRLAPRVAHEPRWERAIGVDEVPAVRGAIAVLWAGAVVAAWRQARSGGAEPWFRRHWMALACAGAAVAEASRSELFVAAQLRAFALRHHLYFERQGAQQMATLGAIACGVGLAWFALGRVKSPSRSLAALALAGFGAIWIAAGISQHEVDRFFAFPLGPLPLLQWLKLAAAGTGLIALGFRPTRAEALR